jgi:WD40 repeat protein
LGIGKNGTQRRKGRKEKENIFMKIANRLLPVLILLYFASIGASTIAQDDDTAITCPGFIESRLVIGGPARVTPGLANNVRAEAGANFEKEGEIPAEATFSVLAGPECSDDFAWWQVDYEGLVGWTVEGVGDEYWLEPLEFTDDGTITRWNAGLLTVINEFEGEANVAYGMAPNTEGNLVALGTGYPENVVYIWDVNSGEEVALIDPEYDGDVRELEFNRDDSLLAISGIVIDKMQLWEMETSQKIFEFDVASNAIDFHPVDNILAFTYIFDVVLWDVDNRTEIARWRGVERHAQKLIFSNDGAMLALVDADGIVSLWDIATQTQIFLFEHNGHVTDAVFTPDGNRLATIHCREEIGSHGICLHLKIVFWDVESVERGQVIDNVVEGDMLFGERARLAFSPDSNLLAMSESARLWLFDVETGRQLVMYDNFQGWNVAFTPDGSQIISAGTRDRVQIWSVP